MAFNEKQSWFMLGVTLAAAGVYAAFWTGALGGAGSGAEAGDGGASGALAAAVSRPGLGWAALTFLLGGLGGFLLLGLTDRSGFRSRNDERDLLIGYRAAAIGGSVLGFGVAGGLFFHAAGADEGVLAHYVLAALFAAAALSYGLAGVLYRRGV